MTDTVLNTSSVPELLLRLIQTEKVRVRETEGVISLIPIREQVPCTARVRGMYKDGKQAVDKFLEQKHADMELER
jgi:hypothetical protein